jgi:hypothetical protein
MSDPEFPAVMALITVIADPAAAKARLQELQAAISTAEARKTEADAAHAENDRERGRLAELEKGIRDREVQVHLAESKIADDLKEIRAWRRERGASRLQQVGPGGLTREPDLSENAPDPIPDRFAEPMGQTRGGTMAGHSATKVRTSPQRHAHE